MFLVSKLASSELSFCRLFLFRSVLFFNCFCSYLFFFRCSFSALSFFCSPLLRIICLQMFPFQSFSFPDVSFPQLSVFRRSLSELIFSRPVLFQMFSFQNCPSPGSNCSELSLSRFSFSELSFFQIAAGSASVVRLFMLSMYICIVSS